MSQAGTQFHVHPDALTVTDWLESFWPALSAENRRKPTLVCEETEEERKKREADEAEAKKKADEEAAAAKRKPPWGSDDDFDPERAWKLIQGLRDDIGKVKTENDDLRGKVKSHEDATKSDTQKLEERATGAEGRAQKAEAQVARLEVAIEKNLSLVQAKRLVGDTKEDLEKDADDLLASFKSEDDDGQEPRRRPKERLRPGAAPGSEPEETDPAKLAEAVSRQW